MTANKILTNGKRCGLCQVVFFLVGLLAVLALPSEARAGYASFVINADNGEVIHSDHADVINHPASLTKMMTLYLLFEALDRGRATLATQLPVSAHAAGQAPSKLGLSVGETISAEDAILALVTKSANDVACAVGEFLGGTESKFAAAMTAKARALGMTKTVFHNASGLPIAGQVTSARDMATLARALIKRYPRYYHYFATREFDYGDTKIVSHNRVLLNYEGADGLKTGYIAASGFNLVTSAKRNGHRLVGVVLGGRTSRWRDQHMEDLLDASFAHVSGNRLPASARVSLPSDDEKPAPSISKRTKSAKVLARHHRNKKAALAAKKKHDRKVAKLSKSHAHQAHHAHKKTAKIASSRRKVQDEGSN